MRLWTISILLSVCSCTPFTPGADQKLEEFISSVLEEHRVPGLSMAVVRRGQTWSRGFGQADVDRGTRVDADTVFAIGSLTKGFTVALLGILLQDNKRVDWNTPLRDILGHDFLLSDDFRTSQTSLADLLSHRMGYPSYFSPMLLAGFPAGTTRKDMVRRLRFMDSQFAQPFRTKFTYSNYMYNLAGYVAERLAGGTTWEELIRRKILTPLGMNSTIFADVEPLPVNMAMPHASIQRQLRRISVQTLKGTAPFGPAGSMASSARDMGAWLRLHLTNASLLNSGLLNDLFEARIATPFGMQDRSLPNAATEDISISYNLGWMTSVYRGYKKVWHSGGISSYASHIWLFPDLDLGIYACTNGPSSHKVEALMAVMYYTADLLLGLEPWLQPHNFITKLQQGLPARPKPKPPGRAILNSTLNLGSYEGIFRHLAFGNITVYSTAQELYMKMGLMGHAKLVRVGSVNEFSVRWIDDLEYLSTGDDSLGDQPFKFVDNYQTIEFSKDLRFVRDLSAVMRPASGRHNVCYYTSSGRGVRHSFVCLLVLSILIPFIVVWGDRY